MDGLRAALLLAAAVALWAVPGPGRVLTPPRDRRPRQSLRSFPRLRNRGGVEGDAPALLVRELAGLLAAGRPAHRIWADAATLYDTDGGGAVHPFTPVLQAAATTVSLGFSPVPVLAAASESGSVWAGQPGPAPPGSHARSHASDEELLRELWAGLAVCVRVSERSGAPLSAVLTRYAGQLDAARDASADRDAALAGPRATVRLLTWLPAGGLLLGYLLGGNPLHVLVATPLGWAAAVVGGGFWLAGRLWSARLVRDAQGTSSVGPG